MKRTIAAGMAAIAAFLAAALFIVDRVTGDLSSGATVRGDGAASGDGAATPQGSAPPGVSTLGYQVGVVAQNVQPVVEVDPPPPPPPPGSWEAVAISRRAGALGKAGTALGQELNELHPALSACFDEDVQARHGTSGVSAVRDTSPQDEAGVTVLVLQVETLNGAIRIVDAPVEARGRASDGLLACAQSKLRGRLVEAPGTRAGGRYRLLYTLLP